MNANYQYAGWTLDLMACWLERIVKNEFPVYADEKTVSMWERVLSIEKDLNMSLEERRRVVEAYLAGPGKMSRNTIKALAMTYTGRECAVYWVGERLRVQFDSAEGIMISVGTLRKILQRKLPAHISFMINERVILPLNNRDLEKFLLKDILFQMRFPFLELLLPDGLESYDPKMLLACRGIGIAAEESMDITGILLMSKCHVPEEMKCIRTAHRYGFSCMELLRPGTETQRIRVAVCINTQTERIDVGVSVVRKNSWRFDGKILMDGSRKFNSFFEEEVL